MYIFYFYADISHNNATPRYVLYVKYYMERNKKTENAVKMYPAGGTAPHIPTASSESTASSPDALNNDGRAQDVRGRARAQSGPGKMTNWDN